MSVSSATSRTATKVATKVVRIRRKKGEIVQDCEIYIGRNMFMGGWKLHKSDWANPFTVKTCGTPEKACELYEKWLHNERPDLIARLGELQGRTLGCWCKPAACHGDVLARLADAQGLAKSNPKFTISESTRLSDQDMEAILGAWF